MNNEANEVTNFMYYMFNKWSLNESRHLFGESLGLHIYNKWTDTRNTLYWYANLDKKCRQTIVNRANEIYN